MKVQLQRIFVFVQIYLSSSNRKTVDEKHKPCHRVAASPRKPRDPTRRLLLLLLCQKEASVCNSKNIPREYHTTVSQITVHRVRAKPDTEAKGWNTIEGGLKFSLWNYWSQRASPNTSLSLGALFLSTISNCLSRWRKHRGPLDINTVTPRVLTVATSRKS